MTSENKHLFYQHFEKKVFQMVFWVSTFHFQIFEAAAAACKLIFAMRTLAIHFNSMRYLIPELTLIACATARPREGVSVSVLFQALFGSL